MTYVLIMRSSKQRAWIGHHSAQRLKMEYWWQPFCLIGQNSSQKATGLRWTYTKTQTLSQTLYGHFGRAWLLQAQSDADIWLLSLLSQPAACHPVLLQRSVDMLSRTVLPCHQYWAVFLFSSLGVSPSLTAPIRQCAGSANKPRQLHCINWPPCDH